jgi:hypothetical protein
MGERIRCLNCLDVIESMHRHDFHYCSCKAVFIDGGNDYTRIGGHPQDWEYAD